ncbi:FadR family transcriptional regulator [Eubacteriales bacterium OttesenSCG-928-A19]|nr:FadR family transcriptional regulator [Eubacteriales bacterium OttesenSCG-928-A19]
MENNHENLLDMPLVNRSLVDRIIDRITEALIRNELSPGDRMPTENELVISLGVGKSSVREAIKILQAMGVVEVRRGEGTFVAQSAPSLGINPMLYQLLLDQGSLEDIFALREVFEPGYTQLAMRNATKEDLQRIEQALVRFEGLVAENAQSGEDDTLFHIAILEATHNPYVIRVGRMILKLLTGSVGRSVVIVPQQAVSDHRKIYDAFIAKDEAALHRAVLDSFQGWKMNQPPRK